MKSAPVNDSKMPPVLKGKFWHVKRRYTPNLISSLFVDDIERFKELCELTSEAAYSLPCFLSSVL